MTGLIGQCPCSGGGSGTGGISTLGGLLLFGLAVALWQTVRWVWSTRKRQGASAMNRWTKVSLVVLLVAATAGVLGLESGRTASIAAEAAGAGAGKLPKLLDLGSKQ